MDSVKFMEFSLLQMRLFIELAEKRSFAKAAESMQLEHSTTSRKLALLEQELGVKLFHRSRPLQLTEEGLYLYSSWKNVVSQVDASLQHIAQLNRKCADHLSVCTCDSASDDFFNILSAIRETITAAHTGLTLQYEVLPLGMCSQRLKGRAADLYIGPPLSVGDNDCEVSRKKITSVSKMVCMRTDNPLSARTTLSIADLADQCFVVFTPSWSSSTIEALTSACRNVGFEPNISRCVTNAHELITGLQKSNDIFLCDCFFRSIASEKFRFAELQGMDSEIAAYWHTDNLNSNIAPFIQAAECAFIKYSG